MNKAGKRTPREGRAEPHNQKRSKSLMLLYLETLMEWPNRRRASKMIGVSRHLPRYWKEQSERGPKGGDFAVTIEGETKEFHEWYALCVDDGTDRVEEVYQEHALGYHKPVIYEGRRMYELDPKKPYDVVEGKVVPNFAKDKDGNAIPLTTFERSETAAHNLLKAYRRDRYGDKLSQEVKHSGGIVGIPQRSRSNDEFLERAAKANEASQAEARERAKTGG